MREKTCCFTGHRAIPSELVPLLTNQLEKTICRLIDQGIRYFGAGGAVGFDTLAAQTVLRLKRCYPQIRLILVLPCHEQTRYWADEDIVRYEWIRSHADKVVYISEQYTAGCMFQRNRHLVNNSSVCVAFCTRRTGGSAYTVKYAQEQGLQVVFLGQRS